ncbi:MAG: YsnF/AvaK domain-containing protein [Thermoproteota archaeon]|nr:YsnF/AvaK domain-containing protein [Thermoproteota archaeon]
MTSSTDQQEPLPPPSSSSILDLDRIIGKNVKTVDYQDVGKVVTTLENEEEAVIIISSEGPHATYNYRVPKNRIQGFDGPDLMLSVARTELADYEINDIKDYAAQLSSIRTKEKGEEKEIVVPVIEEKLNVSKKVVIDEATIIKEPVTETKTIEVSVMHEEIDIEKRAAEQGDTTLLENPPPKNTRTVIRVPLIHEEVKIKKEPYVKEEIVVRKKPRTETKTISEFVIKEKVDTGNNNTLAQKS